MHAGAKIWLAALAVLTAPRLGAECVERGIWHKEVYCTGGNTSTQYVYVDPGPSTEQQVEALLAEARRLIQANELMAARLQVETALRLRPGDANALALHNLLSRLFSEAQARAAREQQEQRLQAALREVEHLEALGQLDAALAKADAAHQLNPADLRAWDARARIRGKMLDQKRARRAAEAAAEQGDYQRALAAARDHTEQELRELGRRFGSAVSWRQLQLATQAGHTGQELILRPRDDTTEEEAAAATLRFPFDTGRVVGLLSPRALGLAGDVPPKLVSPQTDAQRVVVLIEQLDYLEGVQRELDGKIAQVTDPTERRMLVAAADLVRGVKATARAKLINLSVSRPK